MSYQPHDYIFFADDRSGIPTSTMHLADQIAKHNRVFWVNIYTRLPKLSFAELHKAFRVMTRRGSKPAVNQQGMGSTIISATPLQIPLFRVPARKVNGFFASRFFQKLVKQHNIKRPVLITNFPCVVDAFRTLRQLVPEAVQVYYCVDDYTEYPGLNPHHWKTMEQEIFANVDGAVFTSRDLQQNKKRRETLPSLYLSHGVDYKHFSCETSKKIPIEPLEKIKKPIVGYFGTVDTRSDLALIAYLAKRFPHCSFVIMGRCDVSLTLLEGLENVHYLGHIHYSALPHYAHYFDIGLIPYLLTGFTKAVNPLKLMEYFAVGVPVVALRIPNIVDVPGPLYIADSHEDFGNHLETILRSDLSILRHQAQEIAQQNSWSARAKSFVQFVEQTEDTLLSAKK